MADLLSSVIHEHYAMLDLARQNARSSFEKDLVYRRWAAGHGGVYVPVTDETPPNPYLSHIEKRDVITQFGDKLTLVNPAYMTRQVHELGQKQYGLKGHITSLNPIRPENAPDPWEAKILKTFENVPEEVTSLEIIDGERYMRLMRPMVTEKGCLKCHASQGYKVGDIRGGISVSVPMKQLQIITTQHLTILMIGHGILLVVGIAGIIIGSYVRQRHLREQGQAELAQMQLLGEIESANKELTNFAYIISHDLKAPLRGISTLANWLSEDYSNALEDKGKEQLSLLKTRVKRMHDLIEGVLQYSRVGRVKDDLVEVDLNELMPEVIDMVTIPDNISIEVENNLPVIKAESTRIIQLFQNLLSNAVKYMDKPQGQIHVGCIEGGDNWLFSVSDNGPGIEEKHFEKIFQIFQTVSDSDSYESTGVGLSVVKKIVELYGGSIWVESEVGNGCTFYFKLPKENKYDGQEPDEMSNE